MYTLDISKINDSYINVTSEPGVETELADFFSFNPPGFQFDPRYKNKIWNGKIYLYSKIQKRIYRGLLPYLLTFASERNYNVSVDEDLISANEFSLSEAQDFYDLLNIHSRGVKLIIKDYQIRGLALSIRNKRQGLLSPTGSGKSVITYAYARYLLNNFPDSKGLIVVPTIGLVEQLYSDFEDYSSHNDFDVKENVHKIYEGQSKLTDKHIVISTWQSLQNLPDTYFEQFDYVVGEEAHLCKAKTLIKIITACVNAEYRMCSTGTLDGSKVHKLVIEGLFGQFETLITTMELIERGDLAELNIKALVLKHNDTDKESVYKKTYKEEVDLLVANYQRNKFIANLALSLKGNTLILYQYVEKHGELLRDIIQEKSKDREVYFISGDVNVKEREPIRHRIEQITNGIIIASYGTYQMGVNIRNLNNLIIAFPSKGKVRVLQSIGRGLRKGDFKDNITLFDVVDDLRSKKWVNTTLKHFMERLNIYNEQGFPYQIHNIKLKE